MIANFAPIIPGLTDHEIEGLIEAAADAGAAYPRYAILRLSHELRDLFQEWLAAERPEHAGCVKSFIRQTRGGKENDSRFHLRMVGEGPVATMPVNRFRLARRRCELDQKVTPLRTDLFRVLPKAGDQLTIL